MSEPQLNTLICSSKAPTELRRLADFHMAQYENEELNIGVYVKLNHTHSEILNYISRNFEHVYNDPDIGLLHKDEFKLLLKHKYLNVSKEDQVVQAIVLWTQAVLAKSTQHKGEDDNPNLRTTYLKQTPSEMAGLSEILQFVNWDYVTLNCLLSIIRNQPIIRQNASFQKIL